MIIELTNRSYKLAFHASLLLTFFVFTQCMSQPESALLSPDDFERKIEEGSDLTIIDVRTDDEVAQGVIAGAIQINFRDDDFNKKMEALDKNKAYFVYCAAGGRSGKTAKLMADLGFKEVYDLDGGITAWKSSGKELVALD